MVSFSLADIVIIVLFFVIVIVIGLLSSRNSKYDADSFLLSGRKVGMLLFVFTNVATWYGGVLGVGEFTFRYGIVSWFTQGLPYYFFAAIFALLFAAKIRKASLFTLPEKLTETYGRKVGMISAVLVMILVSPAPYLLMLAYLTSVIFGISIFYSMIIALIVSTIYLFKGGYRANLFTDAFQFFIMFAGFIVIVLIGFLDFGGLNFIEANVPQEHLILTGGMSPLYITVWFLIAMWTFTDPGFHQRSYSAKSDNVAKYGILISIILWICFDFLTTSTGLFSRAILVEVENPVMAYPLLADKILGNGLKGIFFAALLATILSTLNSYMFLSATTISRDFLNQLSIKKDSVFFTRIGLAITILISLLLASLFDSIVQMWYVFGSICIPGMIFLVFGAYFEKLRVSGKIALIEILAGSLVSATAALLRSGFDNYLFSEIEPMIFGLLAAIIIHSIGLKNKRSLSQ